MSADVPGRALARLDMSEGFHVRDVMRCRRWREDESGMSLVEIMVAIFVLGIGLMALASTAIVSIIDLRVSQGRQEATDAASAAIEDLRRTDFALVALDADEDTTLALLATTSGCDPEFNEPIVTTAQEGGVAHQRSFGPSGRITISTTISWYDADEDEGCPDEGHEKRVKRVRVVAEWRDGDRTFSVEESTLVSPVDRGLPAPDFRVTPDEPQEVQFTATDVTEEREKCLPHLLRNVGAEDGYQWEPTRVDEGTPPTKAATSYFHTAENKWTIRTFLEVPPHETRLDPAGYGLPKGSADREVDSGLELFIDGDGDGRPETELHRLASGDQAILWVCYRAGSNLNLGDDAEFEIHLRSQFDDTRVETVAHTVEVTSTVAEWFLFDDDPASSDNARGDLPVQLMGPEADHQPEVVGEGALPNYDTDFDSWPGMRLQSTVAYPQANQLSFHQQVTSQTLFDDQVTLEVWTSSTEALRAEQDGTPVEGRSLSLAVTLEVLEDGEGANVWGPVTANVPPYEHTSAGWVSQSIGITLPEDLLVEAGEYVRLTLTCVEDGNNPSEDACHLAYDNASYPALLRLEVKS